MERVRSSLCAWACSVFLLFSMSAVADIEGVLPGDRVIHIHNIEGGIIEGSKNGGETWQTLGRVTLPANGGMWRPSQDNGVLAYDYLRGPSNVFGPAVNNLHLRFSDPPGYELPEDVTIQPIPARGLSVSPMEYLVELKKSAAARARGQVYKSHLDLTDFETEPRRAILVDIPGGTKIFGRDWSPRIGSLVLVGDGVNYAPIPHEDPPTSEDPAKAHILIVTSPVEVPLERIEIDNRLGGLVTVKRRGEAPKAVAKVKLAVEGIGRFGGSEFCREPGVLRVNHAGVLDFCTTDLNTDPQRPTGTPILDLRGGFQMVPSHHFQDRSMQNGYDHPQVYLVVGPLIDPPHLKRYDMGVEATYPLFYGGFRPGTGVTYFRFKGSDAWVELTEAVRKGLFKRKDGTTVKHLRGYIKDALIRVTGIRMDVTDEGLFAKPE